MANVRKQNQMRRWMLAFGIGFIGFITFYWLYSVIGIHLLAAWHIARPREALQIKLRSTHSASISFNDSMNACGECDVGLCSLPSPSVFTEVANEFQIFSSLQFKCDGKITQWKLIDFDPKPGKKVYLDVLKFDEETDRVTWMGYNEIETTGESGWVVYDVAEVDRLKVEKGWYTAFHYRNIDDEPVIPRANTVQEIQGITKLDRGFGIAVDNDYISKMAKIGITPDVPILKILRGINVEIQEDWRTPALAAIVQPV